MWGVIIVEGILLGGSFIYHRWIEDHPAPPRPADISLPRIDNGAPIPLLYGRCRVRAPIMVFSGNTHLPESGDSIYRLDITFVAGVPFFGGQASSPIGNVWAGDVKLDAATDSTPGPGERQVIVVSAGANFTDLFAVGEFFPGSPTQNVGDASTKTHFRMLDAGIDSTQIPGYRSQVVFSFVGNSTGTGLSIGLSPQVPAFAFEVISLSTGTRADMGQSLAEEADPAAVIYDLLTSPWGKLGLSEDSIDKVSFQTASLTLFNEGHGYSRAFEQVDTAEAMIGDVLKQIDGALYQEPTTGKLVLRLARADYNIPDLEDINPGNAKLSNYQVQGWNEISNQVRLTFTQREANYADGLSIGQNEAAAIAQQGKRRPIDIRYVGCCTRTLADKLASRDLAFVARPQVKVTVVTNRSFYQARVLDVYTFTFPELGIDHMVMRVARADFGQLHDNKITLDLIRDIGDPTVGAFPTQG